MSTTANIVIGSLCYLLYEQHVLLLKRANRPFQGFWSPPGGKMEHGESATDCCIREIFEETGIPIHNPQLRGIQTVSDIAVPIHWQLFIFRAHLTEKTAPTLNEAHNEGEMRWFAFDDLATIQRPYTDQQYWAHIAGDPATFWQAKYVYNTPDVLLEERVY